MNWKDQYGHALVEVDPAKLLGLIHDTEVAMNERSVSLPAMTMRESQEMSDATRTLRILKRHAQAAELRAELEGVRGEASAYQQAR